MIKIIKLLIGGSPCTHWSIAQKKNRETTASGIGWELFKNYLYAKERFKPDLFLYENNKSASQPIKDQISEELGIDLMYINSALVSAQHRQRFYAFNWNVEQPQDRGILLKDIIESGIPWNDKAYCLTASYNGAVVWNTLERKQRTMIAEPVRIGTFPSSDGKIKNSQAYKGLGNGWTAEVIIHILSGALKNVDRNEKIVVLSMYDGIGTGRYCLDKMGYKNVEYYAFEIDKFAMKVANDNYPGIIQCGDAFQMRDNTHRLNNLLNGMML